MTETHDSHAQGLRKAAALWTEGQGEKARALCRLLLTARPDSTEALRQLAMVERGMGRREEAHNLLRKAIGLAGDDAGLRCELGNLLAEMGRAEDAVAAWREALIRDPHLAEAQANLGGALASLGRMDEALTAIHHAIAEAPDDALPHCNLGLVFLRQNRLSDAEAAFRRALALDEKLAEAHDGLATIALRLGRGDEALAGARQAAALKPRSAALHFNLGNVLTALERPNEAAAAYRHAVTLAPGLVQAWHNLAVALNADGRPGQAAVCFRQALGRDQRNPGAMTGLGAALMQLGRAEEGAALLVKATAAQPEWAALQSLALSLAPYVIGMTPGALLERHRQWDVHIGRRLSADARPVQTVPDPERRLRIGVLSSSLGRTTAGALTLGGLERLERSRMDLLFYAGRWRNDAYAARFRAIGAWHEAAALPDAVLAERVRADAVDILIDLDGHGADNRLPVFARRPAPVQMAWLGYPGTRGLDAIAHLLADETLVPAGNDGHFSERVIRLSGGAASYTPPVDAPPVGTPPAGADRPVSFGCFGHPLKLTDTTLSLWASVLATVGRSRLVLMHRGLDDPEVTARIVNVMAAHGIEPERIECLPEASPDQALAAHHRVDIALDTYPVSGAATVCEALWMGVPVIALPGPTLAGRRAAALLQAAGLAGLIAKDGPGYVRMAAAWAADRKRLAEFRANARARLGASALCDHARLARGLGEALRETWRGWCREQGG